jgi:dipeptidyl aminopeptidase/acylaminoacyl peptidase
MTLSGEISDALLMIDVLSLRPEIDPARLGLHGLSMGGAIAGCVLARRDDIRAAVLWAPIAHPFDVMSEAAARAGRALDPQTGQGDAYGEAVGPGFLLELPLIQPLEGVAGSTVPLLVLHGGMDPTVPLSEGEAFVEAAAGVRRFTLVEGADHTFQALRWRAQLYAETTAWFKQYI